MNEYSNTEVANLMGQYNQEMEQANLRASELHKQVSLGNQQQFQEQNLIEWQLDLSAELELIGHQLRGHVIGRDKDGNEFWDDPKIMVNGKKVTDEERKLLNERGAQEVEKIIRNYLNRNTLLSNYDLETIKLRMFQFSERLRRFIFLNYEEFGLTTNYKQKHFEMLVMNICDMVESAYFRALCGGERESLRTARQVFQTETPGKQTPYPGMGAGGPQKSQRKWYNPTSW
jgi:hypothetical protein